MKGYMNYFEFMALPEEKRREVYEKMSTKERMIIKSGEPLKPTVIGHKELTEEQKRLAEEMLEDLNKALGKKK